MHRLTFVRTHMSILNKRFPETLFPRKLSADAEQRLRLVQARAEEALVPAATLHAVNDEGTAEAVPMPRLRLDEAAERRRA